MWRKLFSLKSMKKKIIFNLVVFSTIPSLILSVLMYFYISGNITGNYLKKVNETVLRNSQSIRGEFSLNMKKSNYILGSKFMTYYIAQDFKQDLGMIISYYDSFDMFMKALETDSNPGSVFMIYYKNKSLLQGSYFTSFENAPVNDAVKKLQSSISTDIVWSSELTVHQNMQYVTFYRNITNMDEAVPTGMLEVSIPFTKIEQNIDEMDTFDNMLVLYRNEKKEVLFHKSSAKNDNLAAFLKDKQDYILITGDLANGHELAVAFPKANLNRSSLKVLLVVAGIFLLFNLFVYLASRLTSNNIVISLERFINIINKDYRLVLKETSLNKEGDEVNEIKAKFREVLLTMDKYYKEVNTLKMEMLRASINPHLLYNSLSVIKWAALWNKDTRTAEMIDVMTAYYRAALNQGNIVLEIGAEIQMIREYVRIYEYAHSNVYKLQLEIDEEIMGYYTIIHLLQPIVENAIVHGLNGKAGECLIVITGRLQGTDIVFSISDNGYGMDEEKAKKILNMDYIGNYGGFGLKSVIKRIQYYYIDSYGVSIASSPGEGTRVELRVAAWTRDELTKRIDSFK
jgi:two-component system sensor histidine kinase YesM